MSDEFLVREPLFALRELAEVFGVLGIQFCLGGSMASGVRGEWRATNAIDIVCAIDREQIATLVERLEPLFFVDGLSLSKAVVEQTSVNLIHKESCIKVDLFLKADEFQKSQLARAIPELLPGGVGTIPVASAEDVILAKLRWYKLSGEQSERQWRDLATVYVVNRGTLDLDYLRRWGAFLEVPDLLNRLLSSPQP